MTRRLERASAAASRWAAQFTADADAAAKAAVLLPRRHGMNSGVCIANYVTGRVPSFGVASWRPTSLIRESFGGQWKKFGSAPKTRRRLHSAVCVLVCFSWLSRH